MGYQDTPSSPGGGYFIVRNDWHTTWAYQSPYGAGYGTIPYQYITNDGWEAFTAPVPGIGTEDQAAEERDDERQVEGRSTVTIQVARTLRSLLPLRNLALGPMQPPGTVEGVSQVWRPCEMNRLNS